MDKQRIIDNITGLTAEQLFEEIKNGRITLEELSATTKLGAAKRIRITALQIQFKIADEEDWQRLVGNDNEVNLIQYITKHPSGKNVQLAKDKLSDLQAIRLEMQAERQRILDQLLINSNAFYPDQINDLLSEGIISKQDLHSCSVPACVVEHLNVKPPFLHISSDIATIPDGHTEIYFWGVAGSGKTSAIAALLHVALEAGYINETQAKATAYTNYLSDVFTGEIGILPSPTTIETIKCLPFELKKPSEQSSREISLVESSGDIFTSFYYLNANKELPSQTHKDTFDSLIQMLNSKNRKIHLFFIDYTKRNKQDFSGYTQSDYLQAVVAYLNSKKILRKTTDAVYVVVNKCDLLKCSPDEYSHQIRKFLHEANFSSFINTLHDYCKTYNINEGRLLIEPFSVGKIFFHNLCEFNPHHVKKIIDTLLDKVQVRRKYFRFN